jgi:RNA polymerase sigma-70 factor (ECF subfamily)
VTLTGPGGIGKTRLALAVAELSKLNFPDGVAFIPLAATNSPELVVNAMNLAASDDARQRVISLVASEAVVGPSLTEDVQAALTALAPDALARHLIGGLTVAEIASAFLVQETAMGQRITRAKTKIRNARIPYRVPDAAALPSRVGGVLAVCFLIFNEGYLSSGPEQPSVREDLSREALRLTRILHELLPADGEVSGLLALMLLTEARRTVRVSASGELVTLAEQDRGGWDAGLIAEGHALVRERLAVVAAGRDRPGRYQILAAINAVHTSVQDVRDTDWAQVVALYDQLVAVDPSPVVQLNRAIALAELDGPEVALALITPLHLGGYHAYHAARADLLRRLGRSEKARAAYELAIELAGNRAEISYLRRRCDQLGAR